MFLVTERLAYKPLSEATFRITQRKKVMPSKIRDIFSRKVMQKTRRKNVGGGQQAAKLRQHAMKQVKQRRKRGVADPLDFVRQQQVAKSLEQGSSIPVAGYEVWTSTDERGLEYVNGLSVLPKYVDQAIAALKHAKIRFKRVDVKPKPKEEGPGGPGSRGGFSITRDWDDDDFFGKRKDPWKKKGLEPLIGVDPEEHPEWAEQGFWARELATKKKHKPDDDEEVFVLPNSLDEYKKALQKQIENYVAVRKTNLQSADVISDGLLATAVRMRLPGRLPKRVMSMVAQLGKEKALWLFQAENLHKWLTSPRLWKQNRHLIMTGHWKVPDIDTIRKARGWAKPTEKMLAISREKRAKEQAAKKGGKKKASKKAKKKAPKRRKK